MRGKRAPKRKIAPDPKFNDVDITRFVNHIMQGGKKSTAQRIVYGAFEIISEKTKQDPLDIFDQAIKNISPVLEVRSRRIGGANYQIPQPVKTERRKILAYRWMLEAARARSGKSMAEKLAAEILSAQNNEGAAIKKRENVHKMAEANRAFAHFAR